MLTKKFFKHVDIPLSFVAMAPAILDGEKGKEPIVCTHSNTSQAAVVNTCVHPCIWSHLCGGTSELVMRLRNIVGRHQCYAGLQNSKLLTW